MRRPGVEPGAGLLGLLLVLALGACAPAVDGARAYGPSAGSFGDLGYGDVRGAAVSGGAVRGAAALDVEVVRKATRPFRSVGRATESGWTDQYPAGCIDSSAGGQGYHYLNPSLVDGYARLDEPEMLMYAPREDGTLELVGVDYVIPFAFWPLEAAPRLSGQRFVRNEDLQAWTLHMWVWRENPAGLYAVWNPAVGCEAAPAAEVVEHPGG